MNKKFVIISISIALLVVAIITGSSYAYFSTLNQTGSEEVITSGNMALTLTDGAVITTNSMIPGDYIEKEFSVENTGNIASSYDIYLSEVINNFVDQTDLVYEIISLDGGYNTTNPIQVPNVSTKIVNQQSIGVGVTHHYKLKITFLSKNENQDDNQGKLFNATIQVNEYQDVETTINYYLDNQLVNTLPNQASSGYLSSTCDKGATITFDTTNWIYNISNVTQKNTICNIYFEKTYTHKGIMYLNPTDLTDSCDENNSVSTTGTKNGCMKWYIFDDSGDTYKMLLDHDTTSSVQWNSTQHAYEGMKEVATQLTQDTTNWVVSARLIAVEELVEITNTTTFNNIDTTTWFYFDGTGELKQVPYANSERTSAYAWLYNNSYNCLQYGCEVQDQNTFGYWTSSPSGSRQTGVWVVTIDGRISNTNSSNTYGIRPVIEVPKSLFS